MLMTAEWLTSVEAKPKLGTFKTFKESPIAEHYLSLNVPKGLRSLCAQLRCGVLPLNIETGRYHGVPADLRKCELCQLDEVEDEFHFICRCVIYRDCRQLLYAHMLRICNDFASLSDRDKFITIMQSCDQHVMKFISTAWETRRRILFQPRTRV